MGQFSIRCKNRLVIVGGSKLLYYLVKLEDPPPTETPEVVGRLATDEAAVA